MAQNSHLSNPHKQKGIKKKKIKPCVGCGTLGVLMSARGKEAEASGYEFELSLVHTQQAPGQPGLRFLNSAFEKLNEMILLTLDYTM